jgi:hypothetical protein
MNQPNNNPYVGPRTFKEEDKELFFGRDREARDLLSLVVSEQLVLFYAQSGAGKSSLLNTRLIPGLQNKGFEALPVGRVSGKAETEVKVKNIFVYNLMLSLCEGAIDLDIFASMTLSQFLSNLLETLEDQQNPQLRQRVKRANTTCVNKIQKSMGNSGAVTGTPIRHATNTWPIS